MGRPTKYNEQTVPTILKYLKEKREAGDIPYIEEAAVEIDISMETVNQWRKKHKDFSEAIKKIETLQKFMLLKGSIEGDYVPSSAIFQLKANHGMVETSRQEVTGRGGQPLFGGVDYIEDDKS